MLVVCICVCVCVCACVYFSIQELDTVCSAVASEPKAASTASKQDTPPRRVRAKGIQEKYEGGADKSGQDVEPKVNPSEVVEPKVSKKSAAAIESQKAVEKPKAAKAATEQADKAQKEEAPKRQRKTLNTKRKPPRRKRKWAGPLRGGGMRSLRMRKVKQMNKNIKGQR